MRQLTSRGCLGALLVALAGCGGGGDTGVPADAFKGEPPKPAPAGAISPKDMAGSRTATPAKTP